MKTVILCGGRGTRLGEHGTTVPKALIEIGGQPVIWHLLKIYSHFSIDDFVLCLGYLGEKIKQYFIDPEFVENWRMTFAETGLETNTGGRLNRVREYLAGEEMFCVTYGDGLADVNLEKLIAYHRSHGKIATLTAIHPYSNFGILSLDGDGGVTDFQEKPLMREWINGGFFVFNREIFDFLDNESVLEREPLEQLVKEDQLMAYEHTGFWKCADTHKDTLEFNQLWNEGRAGWKVW